jgi:hypothetical protein
MAQQPDRLLLTNAASGPAHTGNRPQGPRGAVVPPHLRNFAYTSPEVESTIIDVSVGF